MNEKIERVVLANKWTALCTISIHSTALHRWRKQPMDLCTFAQRPLWQLFTKLMKLYVYPVQYSNSMQGSTWEHGNFRCCRTTNHALIILKVPWKGMCSDAATAPTLMITLYVQFLWESWKLVHKMYVVCCHAYKKSLSVINCHCQYSQHTPLWWHLSRGQLTTPFMPRCTAICKAKQSEKART